MVAGTQLVPARVRSNQDRRRPPEFHHSSSLASAPSASFAHLRSKRSPRAPVELAQHLVGLLGRERAPVAASRRPRSLVDVTAAVAGRRNGNKQHARGLRDALHVRGAALQITGNIGEREALSARSSSAHAPA